MSKYVNVNVSDNAQDKLREDTMSLLWGYAVDYWEGDTYVIEFDDTVPRSVMRKLIKLIDTYPHDSIIMCENTITFVSLGGHIADSIQFKVNVTRENWKERAFKYAKAMTAHYADVNACLLPAYITSILTGGSVNECKRRWTPTVVDKSSADLAYLM